MKTIKFMCSNPKKSFLAVLNESSKYTKGADMVVPRREILLRDLIGEEYPEVCPISYLAGGSMPTDYLLLGGLARKMGENCTYLEIGSWRGESLANVATYAKECYSISLAPEDAILYSQIPLDKMRENLNYFDKLLCGDKVKHIYTDSMEFDFQSLNKKFDMIFIDGDHSYQAILSDTRNALNLLKAKSSCIVWHDYTQYGTEIICMETLCAILDAVPKDLHKHIYHVSNTACAILYLDDIPSFERLDYPRIPKSYFKTKIVEYDIET